MLKKLDPLLHNELRLSIMSCLIASRVSSFKELKKITGATSGNISVQITKLEDANYLQVEKGYKGKMPLTECHITKEGIIAFENYVNSISSYLKPKTEK